jgi:hypothetical protein
MFLAIQKLSLKFKMSTISFKTGLCSPLTARAARRTSSSGRDAATSSTILRSSIKVAGGFRLTSASTRPQNQKSRGLRSGHLGGHGRSVLLEMTRSPKRSRSSWRFALEVCGRAPSCIHQYFFRLASLLIWGHVAVDEASDVDWFIILVDQPMNRQDAAIDDSDP